MDALSKFVWHDSILTDIVIDRSNPGQSDTVKLSVEWSEWEPKPEFPSAVIAFSDCYLFEAKMNFGVVALETILEMRLEPEDPNIADLEQKFGVEGLQAVVFELNSTASLIRIVARTVTVTPIRN